MINFLNRKNLLALFLGLACVSANSAWGMLEDGKQKVAEGSTKPSLLSTAWSHCTGDNVELGSAVLRDICVGLDMLANSKCSADSKKILVSGIAADLARLFNDGTFMYNQLSNAEESTLWEKTKKFTKKDARWTECTTVAPMLLDVTDIVLKVKKAFAKKDLTKVASIDEVKVSKLVSKVRMIAPIIEMVAVTARAAIRKLATTEKIDKFESCNNYDWHNVVYYSTAALTLTRAVEVLAQSKMDKSKLLLTAGICIIVLDLAAVLGDHKEIIKSWMPKNKPGSEEPASAASAASTEEIKDGTPTDH